MKSFITTLLQTLAVVAVVALLLFHDRFVTPHAPQLVIPETPDLQGLDTPVQQQFQTAIESLQSLINNGAGSEALANSFGELARLLHAYRYLDQAENAYSQAAALSPDQFKWQYLLGHIKRSQADPENATAYFKQALELNPEHVPSAIWLGEMALESRQLEAAKSHYLSALKMITNHPMALFGLGKLAIQQQDYSTAIRHLEAVAVQQPQAFQVQYQLGQAYQGAGEHEKAAAAFNRVPNDEMLRVSIEFDDPLMQTVSDLRASSQLFVRRGRKAMAQGQFKRAVEFFQKAIAANPERTDTRFNLAAALLRMGQRQRAITLINEVLKQEPGHLLSHLLLARIAINQQDLEKARFHTDQAIESDPESPKVKLAQGNLHYARKEFVQALDFYQQAERLDPSQVGLARSIALTLLQLRQYKQAKEHLEISLSSGQDQIALKLLLARILAASPIEELRDAKQASELVSFDNNVNTLETLAMIYAEQQRYDLASEMQSEAITLTEKANRPLGHLTQRLALYQQQQPCRIPWQFDEKMRLPDRPKPQRPPPPAQ